MKYSNEFVLFLSMGNSFDVIEEMKLIEGIHEWTFEEESDHEPTENKQRSKINHENYFRFLQKI